jgi:protein SCO1/2
MKKIVIAWVVLILGLVLLLAWLGNGLLARTRSVDDASSSGQALITADFTLHNGVGKTVTAADYKGRYLLVYFGYTHCPDVCPTTLLLMTNTLNQLGKTEAKVQPIFISIDPERDTPQKAGDYASHFGKQLVGLSGSPAEIKHAADSFKVFYSKVEDSHSALGYAVDHSGFIYLMGPDGAYITHFAPTVSEGELTQGLHHYVR